MDDDRRPVAAALGDTGVASAAYNASMQLGAALGIPLFNTVAVAATGGSASLAATVHGYGIALTVAAAILLAATAAALVATRKA